MTDSVPPFASALLVEDEPNLAIALQVALRKFHIPTDSCSTLREAYDRIRQVRPEFILLDRSLPDGDGITLCQSLRAEGFSGTILILTALGQPEDRVHGLNLGADDYLPKPFIWEELEARIRALARRKNPFQISLRDSQTPPLLWSLDSENLKVFGLKGWISLTPLEFKLASRLIQQSDKIISRNFLLREVWGFTLMPKTRTVDHFLGRLRKYFEIEPEQPQHFLTIRGVGYKFVR